ncbi:asparaginase-domain-containing protein [Cytidiella melzeri]|nr:asparaginase-domain-containing protein [Cytidiella melzeri]
MELSQPSDESKVLVIYTGGTIGMLVGHQGYVPEPYFLTETLYSQHRFHDPLEESLFSHSASVEGFREWSATTGSGRTSPIPGANSSNFQGREVAGPSVHQPSTLLVRSTRPMGAVSTLPVSGQATPISVLRNPLSYKVAEDLYEAHLHSLVTPRTTVNGSSRKRIRYVILEWNPLLDSSNMEIDDWVRVATEIELNYSTFDAFVILHGTDTMSYTSSALSFLLEDLGKTVIVTGAQIPLSQLRNDAVDNLLGALTIAGHFIIPEVCLFFNHTLYRGNRVYKFSSNDLNAFDSPNFPPLVHVGIDISVNWSNVIRQTGVRRFKAHKNMSPHVATLRLFPGITAATIRAFLSPPTRGLILETFGSGNAPQRADLMDALQEACKRGVVIVAISQCAKGSVSSDYETGIGLLKVGVISGADMTPECALTKLGYLLSKPELSVSQVRALMGASLRGEITVPASSLPKSRHSQSQIDDSLDSIFGVLTQVVRLSAARTQGPKVVVTTPDIGDLESAAPWSWTAAEAASTETALLPLLTYLAASKNDVEGLKFCLKPADKPSTSEVVSPTEEALNVPSGGGGVGMANCVDAASGRSPLHVAALNGSIDCVNLLLENGALVHLRDGLGHTALYYAARQGHEGVVDGLIKAGANLGGSDVEGGFVPLILKKAIHAHDERAVRIWRKAGAGILSGAEEHWQT